MPRGEIRANEAYLCEHFYGAYPKRGLGNLKKAIEFPGLTCYT